MLDDAGRPIEADQRALVRHVVQSGHGASIVFAAGTTGEWDRVDNATRQAVIRISNEETRRVAAERSAGGDASIESWAGVTAPSVSETLENLDLAVACGADAAVLAPLAIAGVEDPVRFVARDVAGLLAARDHPIPIYLYDNADIAVAGQAALLGLDQVEALARLDCVHGVKVSASREVVDRYLRAAPTAPSPFGVYVGHGSLIFPLFRPGPHHASKGAPVRPGEYVTGVVAGPANVMPREWRRAWQLCRAGDVPGMDAMEEVLDAFRELTFTAAADPKRRERKTIAVLKRALFRDGVISSPHVAPGTPELSAEECAGFDAGYEEVKALARSRVAEDWLTRSS